MCIAVTLVPIDGTPTHCIEAPLLTSRLPSTYPLHEVRPEDLILATVRKVTARSGSQPLTPLPYSGAERRRTGVVWARGDHRGEHDLSASPGMPDPPGERSCGAAGGAGGADGSHPMAVMPWCACAQVAAEIAELNPPLTPEVAP